jgi:hypothetical protein
MGLMSALSSTNNAGGNTDEAGGNTASPMSDVMVPAAGPGKVASAAQDVVNTEALMNLGTLANRTVAFDVFRRSYRQAEVSEPL